MWKCLPLLLLPVFAFAQPVHLVHEPALSPDGKWLAFEWQGDLWSVASEGGRATRLTSHPALDSGPAFSPDGKVIAFNSLRDGFKMLYSMPSRGGEPKQISFHTDGCDLREWTPEGQGLLVTLARDFSWLRESRASRHAIVHAHDRKAEQVLFDDYGVDGVLSPDGQKLLFVREAAEAWWRQDFKGARAGQIWLFDRSTRSFQKIIGDEVENRWPLWKPDGKGFYFVRDGNLWQHDFASAKHSPITQFKDDLVVFPAISRDGSTLVFRVRFDLYRWHPGEREPTRIQIEAVCDETPEITRVILDKAKGIHFTPDGLQMAFLSGGDVWVMDTELKEPRRVTQTAEEERDVMFSPNGKSLVFVSDAGGQTDLWRAQPAQAGKAWFESPAFDLTKLTDDPETDASPTWTPDGKKLAWLRDRGDLMLAEADGQNARRLTESWSELSFDFSPDSRWVVYSKSDEFYNDDIWLMPLDGSKPAYNVSRHPHDDLSPKWSPDGKILAWVGTREFEEQDVFYVHLLAKENEKTKRERTLAKAREKVAKSGGTKSKGEGKTGASSNSGSAVVKKSEELPEMNVVKPTPKEPPPSPKAKLVHIDFEGLHERVQRIKVPNASESSLTWSPDAKKLAFHSKLEDQKRTVSLEFPDEVQPKTISSTVLTDAIWVKEGDQLMGLLEGKPATLSIKGGELKTYTFKAQQSYARRDKQRAVFDQCWQVMRDHFYDERLGNRDWNAVRDKYRNMAAEVMDMKGVAECVSLMLGELNASHLGFSISATSSMVAWAEETAHLGLRFDPSHQGPGWKVSEVIAKSPASRQESRIKVGESVLKVDGKDVQPGMDMSLVLNGPMERDVWLTISDGQQSREIMLRPISYTSARRLLYDEWIAENRREVEAASGGILGYLHISAMDDASFQKFQEELYLAGAGKDGLVIDVRENGGGSTTDHLLTSLTQPQHAIAIPRGSQTPGYPQDRMVYATWSKPIVVLCNQNSYSNAEVFSHAIKTLKRGKLVGVQTAGGVISTGATSIMDVGALRLPFRGWYVLSDGQDMELNGAKPDHVVWPQPGDTKDRQLAKAIEVLKADVEIWKQRPQPKLIKASERP